MAILSLYPSSLNIFPFDFLPFSTRYAFTTLICLNVGFRSLCLKMLFTVVGSLLIGRNYPTRSLSLKGRLLSLRKFFGLNGEFSLVSCSSWRCFLSCRCSLQRFG